MFILDSLLIGGIRFVLDKIATAVETEMNDDTALREQLLEAQMRYELGELNDKEFARLERDLLKRIREIKEQRQGGSVTMDPSRYKVSGVESVEATFDEE
jgi:gas vesicle protein GvpG